MKIITREAALGRFMVLKKSGSGVDIIGPSAGFDTYEDAEAQLNTLSERSLIARYLILQVTGEFLFKAQMVSVHPTAE